MLYSFPKDMYVIENGVNLSLQSLNDAIVKCFNRMAEAGVVLKSAEAKHFYCVSLKGDWKYLKQSLNLTRYYNTENAPSICLALCF